MKIDIENVIEALKISKVNPDDQDKVVKYLEKVIEEEKQDRAENKVKKAKPELGVILLDNSGEIKNDSISALIYEAPPNSNHNETLDKIKKAAAEFNNTKKGQKQPVKTFSDAFATVKPKQFKTQNLKKKVKHPVICLVTPDNF